MTSRTFSVRLATRASAAEVGRDWEGTGRGLLYVAYKEGDYHDAIYNKLNTVIPFILEVSGGMTPHAYAFLKRLARDAKKIGGAGMAPSPMGAGPRVASFRTTRSASPRRLPRPLIS